MSEEAAELREEILAVQRWAEAQGSAGQPYAAHLANLADRIDRRDEDDHQDD